MKSLAKTPEEYIQELPDDRAEVITKVRQTILNALPKGYEEAMDWGMITYQVPLSVYPDTYNKKPLMYVALASQKNYFAVYLSGVYTNPDLLEKFKRDYHASGKKLDMGASCLRFKKLEDVDLGLVQDYIAKVKPSELIQATKAAHAK